VDRAVVAPQDSTHILAGQSLGRADGRTIVRMSPGITIAIARLETSAGPMLAAFTAHGLAALERGDDVASFGERLSHRYPGAALSHEPSAQLADELGEYLAGERRAFDIPIDLDDLAAFNRRALLAACEIPYGETMTYGDLATVIGHPGAARAVGNALSRSPISIVVPCHRVVRAADGLSGWGGSLSEKRRLLALERNHR
jgi:methylated-DNA-[protein]-cysteine S-methyltransferase